MNTNLEENDIYLLWRHYTLSSTDRKVLTKLYLPLIGNESFSLYLFLDSILLDNNYYRGMLAELKNMVNLSGFSFIQAREKLEAIGLLKTFKREIQDKEEYLFYIQQPLDPEHFFKDVLLSNTLKDKVGEETFIKLKYSFNISKKIDEDFKNISAQFEDYFKIDNQYFDKSNEDDIKLMTRDNEENIYFNFDEFKKLYQEKEPFGDVSKIDDNIILTLNKSAELYHLNMETVVNYYISSLNNRGVFVEKAFMKKVRNLTEQKLDKENKVEDEYVAYLGDNEISRKIKAFTKFSPAEVMYYLSKTKPQLGDYEIFEQLENEYNLSPSVINVIIDFVLAKSNGMFIKSYVLRTARTIVYNDANKDAYLAYVTLNKIFEKAKTNKAKTKVLSNEIDFAIKKKDKGESKEKEEEEVVFSPDDFTF